MKTSEGGQTAANRGGGKGEKQRWVRGHSLDLTLRKGEESGCNYTLCSPMHSCLSDQLVIWLNLAMGQRLNTEVQQLCSSSYHC